MNPNPALWLPLYQGLLVYGIHIIALSLRNIWQSHIERQSLREH